MPFIAPKINGVSELTAPVSPAISEVILLSYNYHRVDCFNG